MECCFECITQKICVQCELCGVSICDDCWEHDKHINKAWEDYERLCGECGRCDNYIRYEKGKTSDEVYLPKQQSHIKPIVIDETKCIYDGGLKFNHYVETLFWTLQNDHTQ